MTLLLDIDGVLVTTPPWRPVELHPDGFLKFNAKAASNLAYILAQTNAAVVLTTTHRITYSLEEWQGLLKTRGLTPSAITKVNERTTVNSMPNRATEIAEWVFRHGAGETYVVLDDDLSLHGLPGVLKNRCVLTKPLIGLDAEATANVLAILSDKSC